MLRRSSTRGAFWTLADQGVVSIGAFAVNILLARLLSATEYGIFAILFSVMLMLQICNASLLFYPLSVRGAVVRADGRAKLFGGGLLLVTGLSLLLGIAMAATVFLLGRPELIGPTLACFLLWQAQEGLRRCLFAEMRHRDALPGDAITYLGQVAVIAALASAGPIGLAEVFFAMAATKGLAVLVQAGQVKLAAPSWRDLRHTAAGFWRIGRWSLANNLLAMLRTQLFPWGLAILYGPAAAASFQAMLNIINLANPVIIGLSNVIPQTAARGRAERGNAHAWRATRGMMVLGATPLALYFGGAIVLPETLLWIVYGPASPYLGLGFILQLLTLGAFANYPVEIICAYLHGIEESRLALVVNVTGAIATLALGLPLTLSYGLVGSCVALALANAIRSVAAVYLLMRVTADQAVLRV